MGVDDCVTLAEVLGERLEDAGWLGELVPTWLGDWVDDGDAAALRDCVCDSVLPWLGDWVDDGDAAALRDCDCDCEGVSVVVGACEVVPDAA